MVTNNPETEERRMSALRGAMTPIISFIEDDDVVEIMLNADGNIWLDTASRGMYCSDKKMNTGEAMRMIALISAAMGQEVNAQRPSLAAKLPHYGARVQAMVPPVSSAPIFALRKPAVKIFTLPDYVDAGIMTKRQADVLSDAVVNRKNILVGGGTGSGKTTLTNALLVVVASTGERVYIVEDNPELQCASENQVSLLAQPPVFTGQQAIMAALRMRPDRIIYGEVRDGTALDLLKAWNTGHPGGLATLHANNPRAMLDRLGQLIEEVVHTAPKPLIAEAVDICVHISRCKKSDKHPLGRRITGIVSVEGIDECGRWILTDVN